MRIALLVLFTVAVAGAAPHAKRDAASVYKANSEAALDRLQKWYDPKTGLWNSYGPSWWQSANAMFTLLEMMDVGSERASELGKTVVPGTFDAAAAWNIENGHRLKRREERNGYVNDYYDDMGWWAMAWIKAYDITRDRKYLDTAETLFEDMTFGWGTNCSDSGLWWDKQHREIAPISNALFIQVAGWLSNRVEGRKDFYSGWAVKAWDWFRQSGMYKPDDHIVNGAIIPQTCEVPKNPHDFTYTNGALLSGLVAMARSTGNTVYMDEAHLIAAEVMRTMSKDGVLQEQNIDNTSPGESAPQFKGVFMRALSSLQTQSPRPEYKAFMQASADSIWNKAREGDADLGPDWNGPFYGPANASPQSSALDCLVAAWKHSRE
jgi:predicted alpha-1,6-mannanase (GH76 family)